MNNEVITFNDKKYRVGFNPAAIDFPEYDQMKQQIDSLHGQFIKWEATPDNLRSSKEVRAKLNKFKKTINDRKIEIVRQADEPVNQFKKQIKDLTTEIAEISEHLNVQIKAYENKAKESRHKYNVNLIERACQKAGVSPESFFEVGYNPSWDNKSYSGTKFQKEVADQVDAVQKIEKQKAADRRVIVQKANQLSVMPNKYITDLDNGKPLDQVLADIDEEHQYLTELAKRQVETKKKEQTDLLKNGDKAVDSKTGEVKEKLHTVSLEITATKFQLEKLASFIKDWGIIAKRVK